MEPGMGTGIRTKPLESRYQRLCGTVYQILGRFKWLLLVEQYARFNKNLKNYSYITFESKAIMLG